MHSIKTLAIKAARVMDGNKDFMAAQVVAVETTLKNKTTAYGVYIILRDDPKLLAGEYPVWGSVQKAGSNLLYDKFTESVDGTDKDNTFWNVYADSTEKGQSYVADVSAIETKQVSYTVKNGEDAGKVKDYTAMGELDYKEALKEARLRRDANRKAINTAARVHFKRAEIDAFGIEIGTAEKPAVRTSLKYKTDADGDKVVDETSTTPIVIRGDADGDDFIRKSVGEFVALDMVKAKKLLEAGNISPFQAVIKSGGKGKKGGGKTGGASDKPGDQNVKTLDQAIASLQGVAHYMTTEDGDTTKGYGKLMTHLASLNANDRKVFVYTIGSACHAFDAFYTEIESEYLAIVQEKARARKAEVAEKAA